MPLRCIRLSKWPVFVLICLLLSGCTVADRHTVEVDRKHITPPLAEINVASVELAPNATHIVAVRVFEWGEFGDSDLQVLRGSLEHSAAWLQTSGPKAPEKEVNIHVLLRHHVVGVTNVSGEAIAGVAWCATDRDGTVIFHEGFFSSDIAFVMATMGMVKGNVNRHILQRIVETTARLASANGHISAEPRTFPNTYPTFKEALAHVAILKRDYAYAKRWGHEPEEWVWQGGPVDIDWEVYLRDWNERQKTDVEKTAP